MVLEYFVKNLRKDRIYNKIAQIFTLFCPNIANSQTSGGANPLSRTPIFWRNKMELGGSHYIIACPVLTMEVSFVSANNISKPEFGIIKHMDTIRFFSMTLHPKLLYMHTLYDLY